MEKVPETKEPELQKPFARATLETVLIHLAPHSENIKINGKQYWHGTTHEVTPALAATLREIMARGWAHERTLHESENPYRRAKGLRV
ncbi:MAG: hypothetical protein ACYCOR_17880 [Acidobacteriaceae bacterium]